MSAFRPVLTALLLSAVPVAFAQEKPQGGPVAEEPPGWTLERAMQFWRKEAHVCAQPSVPRFSSKHFGVPSPTDCNDGDMTLFNGLLCFSGEKLGCDGVREAQSSDGQWHRSPRLMRLGKNDQSNDGAKFSPDMMLGLQLYFIARAKEDRSAVHAQAQNWISWVDGRDVPRVCTEVVGCILAPGALGTLGLTIDYLHANVGLKPLPSGTFRGAIGTAMQSWRGITKISVEGNDEHFPLHLVSVELLIARATGKHRDFVTEQVKTLIKRQPENLFYQWLAQGATDALKQRLLQRCPTENSKAPERLEWMWELNQNDNKFRNSSYWDCIFLGNLLNKRPSQLD